MSNWIILNKARVRSGEYASSEADGFNGFYCLVLRGAKVKVIAGESIDWKHVSVSIDKSQQPPSWAIMCEVKDLFWEPEDCVMQLHPPKSQCINTHSGALHLWQPLSAAIPRPPQYMV